MDNQLVNASEHESEDLLRKKMENNANIEEGGKLFSIYKSLIGPLSDFESLEVQIPNLECDIIRLENKKHWLRNIVIFLLAAEAILTVVPSVKNGDLEGLLIIPGSVFWIVVFMLISRWRTKKRLEKIDKLQNEKSQLEQRRAARLKEIKPLIKYCPPAYRNSEALTYFVDCYVNSRASTLKEAVQEYDSLNRHIEISSSLRNIEEALSRIDSKL